MIETLERSLTTDKAQEWHQESIAVALASEVLPRTHEAFGEGIVHIFGDELNASTLEVWPQGRVVRLKTPTVAIALTNQDHPSQIDEGDAGRLGSVLFTNDNEHYHSVLLVQTNGAVLFNATPRSEWASPEIFSLRDDDQVGVDRRSIDGRLEGGEPNSGASRGIAVPDVGSLSGETPDPSSEPTLLKSPTADREESASNQELSQSKEKPEKVQLEGNVAHPPYYKPAEGNKNAYARFSLATHPEPGETTYVPVYATKRYAEKIYDLKLLAGEAVKVTGPIHQMPQLDREKRPVVNEQGEALTEATVYAYSVKRIKEGNGNT